jgi:signal recognition particle subunit SRP54
MIGQDAVKTAKAFNEGVGIDGLVLTKLDGDARGGAALSIASVTGKPILFASTGEKISDFDLFYPDRMAQRILGLGDVQTLAEQAKKAIGTETAEKLEAKFSSGESFTFEDFLEQLQAMANMGSMTKLLGMLPGNQLMKKQLENFDEREIIKAKSIIQSMTIAERNDPKILNGSRRVRIAKGSGHEVKDVNNLVDRFGAAQKAMKQMRSGGMPGMAGAPQIQKNPMRQTNQMNQTNQKKKSRSGNPAKRAQEEGR